jgi:hypothetical protein
MVYQTGLNSAGAPLTSQKTLNNIAFTATEQAVFDAAHALFGLSQYTLLDVYIRKTCELTNE